jgi:hypothetical protein
MASPKACNSDIWVGFLERYRLGQRLAAFARYATKLNVAKKRPQNSVDIRSMPVIFATKASVRLQKMTLPPAGEPGQIGVANTP